MVEAHAPNEATRRRRPFKKKIRERWRTALRNKDHDLIEQLWSSHAIDLEDRTGFDGEGDHSSLDLAARAGDAVMVQRLLDLGANVNALSNYKASALHHAAGLGKSEILTLLLNAGADLNHQDVEGYSALLFVAGMGLIEPLNVLLNAGADITVQNTMAQTVTHLCAWLSGNAITMMRLLDAGASATLVDGYGNSMLHYMARKRPRPEVLERLRGLGVPFGDDVWDAAGHAPLHIAVEHGNERMVRYLLDHGSSPNAPTRDGISAVALAKESGKHDVWSLLSVTHVERETRQLRSVLPIIEGCTDGKPRVRL